LPFIGKERQPKIERIRRKSRLTNNPKDKEKGKRESKLKMKDVVNTQFRPDNFKKIVSKNSKKNKY